MADTEQAKLLKQAREKLELTTEGLADELGVSLPTLRSWLLPAKAKAHRVMPKTAKLLLARIVADKLIKLADRADRADRAERRKGKG